MNNIYGDGFYKNRHQKTVYSAERVLSIVLEALPQVNSAIDFGCGVGTWLSVLKEKGVGSIQGLDGAWVDQSLLEIPKKDFEEVDLEKEVSVYDGYDLAISLEVAEHLPEESASIFVDSLVNASNFIIFSAAIPLQGGSGHINEQWPEYWEEMFRQRGYKVIDFIRGNIWYDEKIPAWYRQNIFMYVKEEEIFRCNFSRDIMVNHTMPLSLVHPDNYMSKAKRTPTVKQGCIMVWEALFNKNKKE